MKVFTTVMKILAALAAAAAIVYVVVTYGEAIIAWIKKQLARFGIHFDCCEVQLVDEDVIDEEAVMDEAPAEEGAVQAEEGDFEG